MKKERKPSDVKTIYKNIVKIFLVIFIFLRPFVDGITYQGFNHFWNIVFFVLTGLYIIFFRLRFKITVSEAAFFLFIITAGILSFFSAVPLRAIPRLTELAGIVLYYASGRHVHNRRKR